MAAVYLDRDVASDVVRLLRQAGHDVATARELGTTRDGDERHVLAAPARGVKLAIKYDGVLCVQSKECVVVTKVERPTPEDEIATDPRRRAEAVRQLLAGWLADESGYDERVWPELKRGLEESRTTSCPPCRE